MLFTCFDTDHNYKYILLAIATSLGTPFKLLIYINLQSASHIAFRWGCNSVLKFKLKIGKKRLF